ncbi:50S ribosomal protein L2 [Candidatus Gottesmanbacteria bacterium RIFCSPHIGHO2_01_FULL_42_12]|uniref:Large ribosomal subunit protein uL2 n=1 Tax=Candidatus Gottesmanbacteria bacterium RIFCSPHIGHO2_01_FULL_42_12 TaxID=1798377 RepID=A0A1F5Z4D4_9BACT|nr:MAG: 50S ribosomal protein L2 [Candidatus Gottesmanbacteria bacterium RIFCSPHIGHO2_01_FULL_42_12]
MLKRLRGATNNRFSTGLNYRKILTATEPEKSLIMILKKESGRDNSGHISSHHIGGRQKRYYRLIDFRRDKVGVEGRIETIEYDPNRSVNISLVLYRDGDKRYILHPQGMVVGEKVVAGKGSEVKTGNTLPVAEIPVGQMVHNVELTAGKGGQIVRSAGSYAVIMAKDKGMVTVKLPSGETRLLNGDCRATIGQLDNIEWKNVVLGKAGRNRLRGVRPHVRGTAQNPRTHPHGGGEGRSGEGMKQPKTPWGKRARGVKTRNPKKYSNRLIIERRKK